LQKTDAEKVCFCTLWEILEKFQGGVADSCLFFAFSEEKKEKNAV